MGPHQQPIACVIRQYGTGLYRTCVSLERKSAICLSIHGDEASAAETIDRFWETYHRGEIRTLEDISTFINSIEVTDLKVSEQDVDFSEGSLALNE